MLSNHHAILDGWSNPVLLDFVHTLYSDLQNGNPLTHLRVDESYTLSQKYLQENKKTDEQYWKNYITKAQEHADLTGLLLSEQSHIKLNEYKHILKQSETAFVIQQAAYSKLKDMSGRHGLTINTILQYAWHRTVSIYGNTTTTVVGTTVSGRNLPVNDIEYSVGLYINTLPLIVDHQNSHTILQTVQQLQTDINEINTRSSISLSKLQPGGKRLFDSLFIYENYPTPVGNEKTAQILTEFKGFVEKLDYPIGIVVQEFEEKIILKFCYAGELFAQETIEDVLETFNTVLLQVVDYPEALSESISSLSPAQYQTIIHTWNDTAREYPAHKTIHQLFEEQVER
ncbi:MAG: condensation domain-containing protein, partial [bacterium]